MITASSLPAEVIYNMDPGQDIGADWPFRLDAGDFNFNQYLDNLSKGIIIKALQLSNGNVKKTAQLLQLNYRSLRYLIEKYKLKFRA